MPMEILKIAVKTFWRGEADVTGVIKDAQGEYKVRLEMKGDQVYGYACSCAQGTSYRGMCEHAAYLLKHHQQKQQRMVMTSAATRALIRDYTNDTLHQLKAYKEQGLVELIPIVKIKQNVMSLEFQIKKEAIHPLVNLVTFVEALEQKISLTYGKRITFYHTDTAFQKDSQALLSFLKDFVQYYREMAHQFPGFTNPSLTELRSISLKKAWQDRFFEISQGRVLRWLNAQGVEEKVTIVKENPPLAPVFEMLGSGGVTMKFNQQITSFFSEKFAYVKISEQLYCCDEQCSQALKGFLEQIKESRQRSFQIEIQNRDMPLFYDRVLKRIRPYMTFQLNDINLDAYEPEPLQADFYFDSDNSHQIILQPLLRYGEYSFHPAEDVVLPKTICRDLVGEFKISQLIARYFRYHQLETGELIIQQDDDTLYDLLKNGMNEFRALGEVHLSESCKNFKVVSLAPTAVSVKVTDRWLDLTIDTGELSRADLYHILKEYRQKKSYHRLKNGEFISLNENGLLAVVQLVEQCGIKKEQLNGESIRLPLYRGLYLDSLLQGFDQQRLYRDRLYQALIAGMNISNEAAVAVPKTLERVLRPYQREGVGWLKTLDHYGFGGILADDMGLGKTLQVIAILLDHAVSAQGEENIAAKRIRTSLVVCPASLIYNWEHELVRFAPLLKTCVIAGKAVDRQKEIGGLEEYDVVITSYDLLKRDIERYQNSRFRYQIIDEAQTIKNAGTQSAKAVKAVQAVTRFALTGTPIENHLGELWSIFDYLMPGFLFSYPVFKKRFEVLIVKENNQAAMAQLHQMVSPFILRRLKKDLLTELPAKIETTVYAGFETEQHKLYVANATLLKDMLMDKAETDVARNKLQILAELTKLRQICCDPRLYYQNYKGKSAKLETCMELVKNGIEGGHRILVFSQFTTMLGIIEEQLKQARIGCLKLTGATPKESRMQMVEEFQTGKAAVFLISLKAGGTGLNLTAADIVIHYDPWWNIAVQNQASDRAYRIGQTKQVTVFQLIVKNTIEEQILKLQQSKSALAEQIITHGSVSLSNLTKENLLAMLEIEKAVRD